jgi:hypothetical protein
LARRDSSPDHNSDQDHGSGCAPRAKSAIEGGLDFALAEMATALSALLAAKLKKKAAVLHYKADSKHRQARGLATMTTSYPHRPII